MGTMTITYYEDETINEKCGHNFKMITGVLTFTTYNTDGVAFDLRKQLPTKVHQVIVEAKGGYSPVYDYTNRKLLVYYSNLSYATDGAQIQVADAVDLSTVMADTRFTAIGK